MAQKAAIKSRIKSINATKKITGAMELIATVKLQKERNRMLKNREYASVLKETLDGILSRNIDVDNELLKEKDNPLKFFIVFCSDLGLCGAYNMNIFKFACNNIKKDDLVYVIGTSQYKNFKQNFSVINDPISSDEIDYTGIKKITMLALNKYRNNEVGSIEVIYTKFVNNVTFETNMVSLLPAKNETKENTSNVELLLEPNPETILNDLIPMVIDNEVYAKLLESKTSEQGSRRFAMENATDNAEELTNDLLLAYNQARQAAITQEITEIVGGADAL